MNISVIVPTYRRSQDLKRCLESLQQQTRLPNEVIVVVRDTDAQTWEFLANFESNQLNLRTMTVKVTGVIAAMNIGLETAEGDIIAFTDDDAAPHRNWLEKIEASFLSDERIGGVGGRDLMYDNGKLAQGQEKIVGKIQWHGRTIGNHHAGIGKSRAVEVLKGVNMSFRRRAISNLRFDTRMLGTGAQVHFEIAFCTKLIQAGWTLIYDPEILVNHYRAVRYDEDLRHQFNETAWFNEVHNKTLALLEYLPPIRRKAYLLWSILIGTRKAFGLVQLFRFLPKEGRLAIRKWQISQSANYRGWQNWQTSRVGSQKNQTLKMSP